MKFSLSAVLILLQFSALRCNTHQVKPALCQQPRTSTGDLVRSPLRLRGGSQNGDVGVGEIKFQNILLALEVLHNPSETKERRDEALSLCQGVKERNSECRLYAEKLMLFTLPDPVRHFGLQLYEHLVTVRWKQLPATMREELKVNVMTLLYNGTKSIQEESNYIKGKIVQVVVKIALQEWPRSWPNLLSDLHLLAGVGETQCELAVMVWRALPEEFMLSPLSIVERNQMIQTWRGDLERVVSSLRQLLISTFTRRSLDAQTIRMVQEIVRCIEVQVGFTTLQMLAEKEFDSLLLPLLDNRFLRDSVLDVVSALINKNNRGIYYDSPEQVFLWSIMRGMMRSCHFAMQASSEAEPKMDDYEFLKHIAQIFCEFGVNFWPLLERKEAEFEQFTSVILTLSHVKSLNVLSLTLSYWGAFIERKRSGENATSLSNKDEMLLFSFGKILEITVDNAFGSNGMSKLDEQDFVEEDEFVQAWFNLRSRILDFVRKMSILYPSQLFLFTSENWKRTLSLRSSMQQPVASLDGKADAWYRLLEKVVESLPQDALAADSSCYKMCAELVESLTDVIPHAIEAVTCSILRVLGIFQQLYINAPESVIVHVTKKVLQLLALPGYVDNHFIKSITLTSPEVNSDQNIQRTALAVLVKIGTHCASKLTPHLQSLIEAVQGLAEQIESEGQGHLIEFLLLVTTQLDSPYEKSTIMGHLLGPLVQEWETLTSLQDYSQNFLSLCFEAEVSEQCARPKYIEEEKRRLRIHAILHTFNLILRRLVESEGHFAYRAEEAAKSANIEEKETLLMTRLMSPYIWRLLPNLMLAIQGLHNLWAPELRSKVLSMWKGIYFPLELLVSVDPNYKNRESHCGTTVVSYLCGWIRMQRDLLYEILMNILYLGAVTGIHEHLAGDVSILQQAFHNSINIENRHIRSLVRSVLLPILKSCNSRYLERILSPILPPLLNHFLHRLSTGYEAIVYEKPAEQFMDDDVVMRVFGEEMIYVVRENSLRHLHRDICDLALTICNMAMQSAMLETGGGVESSSSSVPAAEVVLRMHGAMAVLLNILSNSLVWEDSMAGLKAIEALQRMMPKLSDNAKYRDFYVKQCLQQALHCLKKYTCRRAQEKGGITLIEGKDDGNTLGPLLALITDIYVSSSGNPAVHEPFMVELGMNSADVQELHFLVCEQARNEKQKRLQMRAKLLKYIEQNLPKFRSTR